MKTVPFNTLSEVDRLCLREAVDRLSHALNKVSNPMTSAIAVTENEKHYGNNIFLSNCTLFCAEAMALAAAVAANDKKVTKVYLASGRGDMKAPKLITPCGNCRQILHDFSQISGSPIEIIAVTNQLDNAAIMNSDELLPSGFMSASLGKMAR